MSAIDTWFQAYGHSHQNKTNKAIHWICVPLIFYSFIGLLSYLRFDFLNEVLPESWMPYAHLGTLLIVGALIFFVRLSFSIAVGMLVVSGMVLYLVNYTFQVLGSSAWQFFVGVFVVAWIGQFIGHKIEGVKPSFFDDLKFLMIGPAWLLHFIYRKLGIPY